MKSKNKYRPFKNEHSEKLLSLLDSGDSEALEEIYRRNYSRLMRYGMQVTQGVNSDIVQKVIQDFFMWLAKNYKEVHKIHNFELYAFQSIRKNTISLLSAESKRRSKLKLYLSETEQLDKRSVLSHEDESIKIEIQDQQKSLISRELKKLPHSLREAIYFRYFEYKKYPEIAIIMEISEQVARNYVNQAVKRLRANMNGIDNF